MRPSQIWKAERKAGQFILDNREMISACTDLSDGGLAMLSRWDGDSNLSVTLDAGIASVFGEDRHAAQSRLTDKTERGGLRRS